MPVMKKSLPAERKYIHIAGSAMEKLAAQMLLKLVILPAILTIQRVQEIM
jgi:hypothetical protein